MYSYCDNNPVNKYDPNGTDAVLITDYEWGDGGLPFFGHSLLIIEDENGIWWLTEFTGPINDKTKARVRIEKIGNYEDVEKYYRFQKKGPFDNFLRKYKLSGEDKVYLNGDYTASLKKDQSLNYSNFGGYNLLTNNCLHYVKNLLVASESFNLSDFGVANMNFNIIPRTFSSNVSKWKTTKMILFLLSYIF